MNKLIIGLTGLIGSGKTTVSNMFAKLGASIIDTDVIAHSLTAPGGEALSLIEANFGTAVLDEYKQLDRAKLRALVFNNQKQKDLLESLLHPLIFKVVESQVAQFSIDASSPYIIVAVPLLFKSQTYLELVDLTVFVDSPEDLIYHRVKIRSNLTNAEISQILASQVPADLQKSIADEIITNDGELHLLESQIKYLHNKFCQV